MLYKNDFSNFTITKKVNCESQANCYMKKQNTFLYNKYSSSQNYYYTKEVNNILAGNSDRNVIIFNDLEVFDEKEDLLKRMYQVTEYCNKIELLTEYYKYHEDVPRIFMKPVCKIIHNFYDKKRRINYLRIKKILNAGDSVTKENIKIHDSDTSRSCKESIYGSLLNLLSNSLKNSLYCKKNIKSKKKRTETKTDQTILKLDNYLDQVFEDHSNLGISNFDIDEFPDILEFGELDDGDTYNDKIEMNFKKKNKIDTSNELKMNFKQPKLFDKKSKVLKNKNLKKIIFKNFKKESILEKLCNKKVISKFFKKKEDFKQTLKKKKFSLKNDFVSNSKIKKINSKSKSLKKKYKNLNIKNLNININLNPNKSEISLNPKRKKESLLYYSKENNKLKNKSPVHKLVKKDRKEKVLQSQQILKNTTGNNFIFEYEKNPYARTLEKMSFKKKDSCELKLKKRENISSDAKIKNNLKQVRSNLKNLKNFENLQNLQNLKKSKKPIENITKKLIKNPPKTKLSENMNSSIKIKEKKLNPKKKNLQSFKSNRLHNNQSIKIFLSHEQNKQIKNPSQKLQKLKKSSCSSKIKSYNKKRFLHNFLEDSNLKKINNNINLKYSTFANNIHFCVENKTLNDNKYNKTINYLELFKQEKQNFKESTPKKNIKKLLKGLLKRKISQKKSSN